MSCKYCERYIELGYEKVENFEKACNVLRFDPKKETDHEAIVRALSSIGQFGAIRLARRFPFVTDEEEFGMVTRAALEFYWMILNFWEEERARNLGTPDALASRVKPSRQTV